MPDFPVEDPRHGPCSKFRATELCGQAGGVSKIKIQSPGPREAQMHKRSPIISLVTALALLFSLCSGIMIADRAQASTSKALAKPTSNSARKSKAHKVSPGLKGGKDGDSQPVDVIVQIEGKVTGKLNALLNSNGVHVNRDFKSFNSFAVRLPSRVVEE